MVKTEPQQSDATLPVHKTLEEALSDHLVTFEGPSDPSDPRNWNYRYKVMVTVLYGLTTACSTLASSVFSPALSEVSIEYGVSKEVAVLAISLFVLGYVPGPVIFAPLSELYGRKISVLLPLFNFLCFSAATATATNLQTIFITRFFAGIFASAPVSNVGGGLSDMFDQRERGTAANFYALAVVAGPTLGPIIGSAITQSYLGWRWTEYIVVILTGTVLLLDIFILPETYAPTILTRKAQQRRKETASWAYHSAQELNPRSLNSFLTTNLLIPMRLITREPMVFCITLYNSFTYGILYLLFGAVPFIYEDVRGLPPLRGSLPFIGVLLGCFVATATFIIYNKRFYEPYLDAHGGKARPKLRLPIMMLGGIIFPIGFFLLGWTSDPNIHWFPSVLGLFLIGVSFLLIFGAGLNYLIDSYTPVAASAVASNTFMRSFFAAGLSQITQPMFRNLGAPWACTLLGCISVILAFIPFLLYRYGPHLRAMSKMTSP